MSKKPGASISYGFPLLSGIVIIGERPALAGRFVLGLVVAVIFDFVSLHELYNLEKTALFIPCLLPFALRPVRTQR
jgi:hypothetical protein